MATEPSPPSSEPPEKGSAAPAAKPADAASRAPFYAVLVALALPGSLSALWLAPRPAYPAEIPPLVVPSVDVIATRAWMDELAAARPPRDGDEDRERTALYLEHGVQEVRPTSTPGEARTRDERLEALGVALVEAGTIDAVRAADVEATVEALSIPGDEALGEKGAFPGALELYGAVVEGRRVAPAMVVDALAWARWNGIHRRPLTEGMNDTLLLAYHGWLAYYGPREGTELRDAALAEYMRVGGGRGLETEGFLRLSRDDTTGARLAFDAAYEATGNVRLRNHALALDLVELEREDVHPSADGS